MIVYVGTSFATYYILDFFTTEILTNEVFFVVILIFSQRSAILSQTHLGNVFRENDGFDDNISRSRSVSYIKIHRNEQHIPSSL